MNLLRMGLSLVLTIFCSMSAATSLLPSYPAPHKLVIEQQQREAEQRTSNEISETKKNIQENNLIQEPVEQAKTETTKESADVDICNNFSSPQDKLQCLEIIAKITMNTAAAAVCNRFPLSQEKLQCLNILAGKSTNDPVKELCNSFDTMEDKIQCLSAISEKTVTLEGAAICNKFSDTSRKLQCIEIIGSKTINIAVANMCSRMIFNSPGVALECLNIAVDTSFSPLGLHICSRFYISLKHKLHCLDIIAGKTLNESAAAICESFRSVSPDMTLQCLTAIAGKAFSKKNVIICKKMVIAENKLQCLQQIPFMENPPPADASEQQNSTQEPNHNIQPFSPPASNPDLELNLELDQEKAQPKLQI